MQHVCWMFLPRFTCSKHLFSFLVFFFGFPFSDEFPLHGSFLHVFVILLFFSPYSIHYIIVFFQQDSCVDQYFMFLKEGKIVLYVFNIYQWLSLC
jgi:hypothetical protein